MTNHKTNKGTAISYELNYKFLMITCSLIFVDVTPKCVENIFRLVLTILSLYIDIL